MSRRARAYISGRAALTALAIALGQTGPVQSAAAVVQQARYQFSIDGGSLRAALTAYGRVTGRQLLYPSALVAGKKAPRLRGRYTAEEALSRLLEGTGIEVRRPAADVIVLAAGAASQPRREAAGRKPPSPPSPPPVAHDPDPDLSEAEDGGEEVAEIVVTGTNIRGLREGPSQVIVVDRGEIERSGYGTLAEALASLPQNFGGTANEDTSLTGADRSSVNAGLGSSVNLRGLGSDATLTLVNGRRLAGSGALGDFADLSSIPTGAIERVEILTDGASALYGSDAIGGVVNVILRKTLEGGETRVRVGGATSGGAEDVQFGQLLGTRWSSGHVLGAYEFQRRGNLKAADRPFTRSADLRPLGGSDHRVYFSNPGTILSFDPATGALLPTFAVPAGQDGTDLEPEDFQPGSNLASPQQFSDLLPKQTRHSLFATAEQEVGAAVRLFAEARYAHREFEFASASATGILQVTPANPYFVSPDGAPFTLVAYSFADELGALRNSGAVEALSATAGGSYEAGGGWLIDAYVTHASETTRSGFENIPQFSYLNEALGTVPDDPGTGFSTAADGFFNPFGDGVVNSTAVLDFIAQGYSSERIESGLTAIHAKADGTLFEVPGGSVRAAIGGTYRRETFIRGGESFLFGTAPTPLLETDAGRSIRAVFGEVLVPLVGSRNPQPWAKRLELSAALRYEHYSDFGDTADPKVGLVWEPVDGLALRGSYGTSFRAPALREVANPISVSANQLTDAAGVPRPIIFLSGGNPDLRPEQARSITLGARVRPPRSRFRAEVTYFVTRFSERIGTPVFEDLANVLRDEIYSPFVDPVSPATNPADRERVVALMGTPGAVIPPALPPEAFAAIVDGRSVNTSSVTVRGLDFTLKRSFEGKEVEGSLDLNASYLIDYKTQVTPAAPVIDRVDTVGNPVDLRLRATGNLNWRRWGATMSVNYVDGYTDNMSSPARPIDSWTTVDAQLRYRPADTGPLAGTTVSLSAQNLLNAAPPFVDRFTGFGYDATNSDALGRLVAVQIIKSW